MDTVTAEVFFNEIKVGVLGRTETGYEFIYDKKFLESKDAFPISWSLPLTSTPYRGDRLFPFFEGLVSEGWLLQVQSRLQKVDERDYFSLLLKNGRDLIGGVKVIPQEVKT